MYISSNLVKFATWKVLNLAFTTLTSTKFNCTLTLNVLGKYLLIYLLLFILAVHDEQPVMGNLLKLLTREEQDASGNKIDIFLDFESKFYFRIIAA